MHSAILVHPTFDAVWPLAADHARRLWTAEGDVEFIRVAPGESRPVGQLLASPERVTRLMTFSVPLTVDCVDAMPALREAVVRQGYVWADAAVAKRLDERGVRQIKFLSDGYWGQSVAEFGLALTLCGLRRIPQTHHSIIADHADWQYDAKDGIGTPGARGQQFGDDDRFTNGTLDGKRVRVVGAGNVASRYASFCHFLGADVVAYDPFAPEPSFHRAGSRREYFLDRLMTDAEIFAPVVPLTEKTRGLITADHIDALPNGCLVVLITRAAVVDMPALRRRVMADELALAADVFDIEPLPLGDPLLGRHNVVHTPHNAGRTRQANEQFAKLLVDQFTPA